MSIVNNKAPENLIAKVIQDKLFIKHITMCYRAQSTTFMLKHTLNLSHCCHGWQINMIRNS